jgi:hypothetical protein
MYVLTCISALLILMTRTATLFPQKRRGDKIMEQSSNDEEEECGICLDALTNPVSLPCSHKFCSECLNGYGIKSAKDKMDRKCPLCRERIPPSKEMVAQLKWWRNEKSKCEAEDDVFSKEYMIAKSEVERLEHDIGDWTETIDYSQSDGDCVVLPTAIHAAASENDIWRVLDWLGPHPVDKQRVNAKNPEFMDFTLVFTAVRRQNSDLLSILMQLGADVDPVDANGGTPLVGLDPEYYIHARLLLEWGAEISICPTVSKDEFIECALQEGNTKLANLLKSEFGGRRCEIINLPNHPDLNGSTCVVEKYLPNKGRYKVVFEASKEVGLVGPENLKRRDRTPDDCGYYITYKNGRTTRIEFASKEECQTFVASLSEDEDKLGDEDNKAEAEARAEQAAESLLAELSLDSSTDSVRRDRKGKKKGKKKGGRK